MCVEVLIGTTYCTTKGELEAALGGPVVGNDDTYWPDHCCLCPLDEEATATRYGYTVDRSDPCTLEFRR